MPLLVVGFSFCRMNVSAQAKQSAQLVLPESLQTLPLYTLGLLKHPAFRAGTTVTMDGMDCVRVEARRTLFALIFALIFCCFSFVFHCSSSHARVHVCMGGGCGDYRRAIHSAATADDHGCGQRHLWSISSHVSGVATDGFCGWGESVPCSHEA